jgi:hypothetical protein
MAYPSGALQTSSPQRPVVQVDMRKLMRQNPSQFIDVLDSVEQSRRYEEVSVVIDVSVPHEVRDNENLRLPIQLTSRRGDIIGNPSDPLFQTWSIEYKIIPPKGCRIKIA